jgi:hypothetical protein
MNWREKIKRADPEDAPSPEIRNNLQQILKSSGIKRDERRL